MKKLLPIVALILLQSCQYFENKVPNEKELLDKQIKEINWNEVDEYPSVTDCEKLTDANQRKQCFFEFLTNTIQQKLDVDTLSMMFPKLDTIEVKVTVLPNSTMEFEPQFPKDSVAYDTIKIDSILHVRLVDFPKVNPAIKRGIPVKTQFVLPVIIKSE
ncbi:hypothetical protein QWY90_12500 [Flavobacterium paronense]|uniref:Lipoprotein n=1 Tax=Flavobacterium paronense TaxID=1392775 RepID=A0ABV5GDX5_9FLAO|nr:hypothetical protein [Flavobacterium paronense]MDN3678127.1 hypothetical protein [Flavobacterium paronense]